MNIVKASCFIAIVPCTILSGVVAANPGEFDPTFNGVGLARDSFPLLAGRPDVALQRSGEIVTIMSDSRPALWRRLPDGTFDTRFGGTGMVVPPAPADYGGSQRIAIDNLNRIVFVGLTATGFIVYRLNFDGSMDLSFGTSGTVQVPVGGLPFSEPGIAVQSDNRIVGVGGTLGRSRFIAYRLDETGELDPTFGGTGIVFTEVTPGGGVDRAWAAAVQADRKIVATGRARSLDANFDYAMVRYLPTGALDPDFGNDGKVVIHILDLNFGRKVAIQPDGKILITGSACRDLGMDQLLCSAATVRVDDRGSLDPTFGDNGKVLTSVAGLNCSGEDVAVSSAGNILVVGNVSYDDTRFVSNAILLRYLPNGSLDTSFGEGGISETNFGYYSNAAFAMAIASDNMIISAAATGGAASNYAVTARYQQ